MLRSVIVLVLVAAAIVATAAEPRPAQQLLDDYAALSRELTRQEGEVAEVSNFVYQKDIATLTLKNGKIHLLRYIQGRPTTAVFVGQGHLKIDIPAHVERQSLLSVTGDSVVSEDFKVCIIRMADDFDLKLKQAFDFTYKRLHKKDLKAVMKVAGEYFFKPTLYYQSWYDSHFQLLRSCYQRAEDGYFWIDCNRHVFIFDPNISEQVQVWYEFKENEMYLTPAAFLQRRVRNVYEDNKMSDMVYETTGITTRGTIEMGGIDGRKVLGAEINCQLEINVDSLKFLSFFLHHNLKIDSVYCDGQPVFCHRRKDFDHAGVVLPQCRYRGNNLVITFWYRGVDYDCAFPWIANPAGVAHALTFVVPKGYDYIIPGRRVAEQFDDKRETFSVMQPRPYQRFFHWGFATGYDTVSVTTMSGTKLHFVDTDFRYEYVSEDVYRQTAAKAFDYFTAQFGVPAVTDDVYISPRCPVNIPGLMYLPDHHGTREIGGFDVLAGDAVACQWFGESVRLVSWRESWMLTAVPEYLGLLFMSSQEGLGKYYTALLTRRKFFERLTDRDLDLPLGVGTRAFYSTESNKGVWLLHMLRFLMFDVETLSDNNFFQFLRDLITIGNQQVMTNEIFVLLAEKYYGAPLDWFFKNWMYGFNFPKYKVRYSIDRQQDGYYLNLDVKTKDVLPDFRMPVMMRVEESGESIFVRRFIEGVADSLVIGPFETRPTKVQFNEFYSVLATADVKQR